MENSNIKDVVDWYKKAHRYTNYTSAAMLYLQSNYFLEDKLLPEHIKSRLLGHWGTVPGLNFFYLGLNYIISQQKRNILYLAGPGHGAPAIISNLYLEGTLSEYFAQYPQNENGYSRMLKDFSWPDGLPSHTYPGLPGSIHEGGELGYSLGVAYGAVLDNPDLTVACVVGDGEAETATLAASWQSNKFINPVKDGVVLPILHLNGYKISTPTILGTMKIDELFNYFLGLGYDPILVNQYDSPDVYTDFIAALEEAFTKIDAIKKGDITECPKWPIIIFKSKKGWTCPPMSHNIPLEDSNLSHNIPLKNPKTDPEELESLEKWLKSYKIEELIDQVSKRPIDELKLFFPQSDLLMGNNRYANGSNEIKELIIPNIDEHLIDPRHRGEAKVDKMEHLSIYLRDVFKANREHKNFRIYSPDESESNMLEALFPETGRAYMWPIRPEYDVCMYRDGRIMEILSENVLQTWMQGYNLTGRYGVYISYEAFLSIITSQIDQYIKYIKQCSLVSWRKTVPSMNYVATSTLWRQEHNGFTHQNPGLISTLLTKQSEYVSLYFPCDANTLICTMDDSLKRQNNVNLIIAGKRNMPEWLDPKEAKEHVKKGISVWNWAGTTHSKTTLKVEKPDVVLASCGDYQTEETLAAVTILKQIAPEMKIQFVNINELTKLGFGDEKHALMSESDIEKYFTKDRDVIFNFHGYPDAIKQLTWNHEISFRLKILGYLEEGTTTTPFDMQIRNRASRYHVCIEALNSASKVNPAINAIKDQALDYLDGKIQEHKEYIVEHGDDMPEIREWKWQ